MALSSSDGAPRCHAQPSREAYLSRSVFAGSRQTARIRQKYLEKALLQDIPHFDTDMTSGDVLSGLSEDCEAVQTAISEKVGNTIKNLTTFIFAVGIALWRGWQLTLVMLVIMPLIVACAGYLTKMMVRRAGKMAEAYSQANNMSTQAITNIRTVASFQAEKSILQKYAELLEHPRKISIRIGFVSGVSRGAINGVVYFACVLNAMHCLSMHTYATFLLERHYCDRTKNALHRL
jgi:ATP-binding cassette, subfamily B (MDR/TAP), member 1